MDSGVGRVVCFIEPVTWPNNLNFSLASADQRRRHPTGLHDDPAHLHHAAPPAPVAARGRDSDQTRTSAEEGELGLVECPSYATGATEAEKA